MFQRSSIFPSKVYLPFNIFGNLLHSADSDRNLGVLLYLALTCKISAMVVLSNWPQWNKLANCSVGLNQCGITGSMWSDKAQNGFGYCVTKEISNLAANALVSNNLDYRNCFFESLFRVLCLLQCIQNSASRVVSHTSWFSSTSSKLKVLLWLQVQHVNFQKGNLA